jgi:replicative DNA helicase
MRGGNIMNLYDVESERAILAAMMIDSSVIERLMTEIGEEYFTREVHRKIFSEIVGLHRSRQPSDLKAVHTLFSSRDDGPTAMEAVEIHGSIPTAANVDYYSNIVKDFALRRLVLSISSDAAARVKRVDETGTAIAVDVEKQISAVNLRSCGSEYKKAVQYLGDVCTELDWAIETYGKIRGVDAPFPSLDDVTGFRNGEYIIIAARPSQGKTAMALNMVEEIAVRRKVTTGMFSVEMSAKQLNFRMVCTLAGFSTYGVSQGLYRSTRDKERLSVALQVVSQAPLYIDETSSLKLSELKTKARRMVRVDGCKIIFVDYIGLIDAEQPKIPRHEQIAEISRNIKTLAKELDIPIVVLSQLTRDTEGKRPTLNSLAETRSLEQDADVVAFIHRERLEDMEKEQREECERDGIPTELIVAKNRNGPTGIAQLVFHPRLTKFTDTKGRMQE